MAHRRPYLHEGGFARPANSRGGVFRLEGRGAEHGGRPTWHVTNADGVSEGVWYADDLQPLTVAQAKREWRKTRTDRPPRKWIQAALSKHKRGALHRQLHVPAGEKIPLGLERKAAHAPGLLGQRARLALTLRKISQKRRRRGRK